jgi:hypothetical protein
MSMTRTIRRNMIRREMNKDGRRHYNRTREKDEFGNKLPSTFASIWKKLFGQKHTKVKKCAVSERR